MTDGLGLAATVAGAGGAEVGWLPLEWAGAGLPQAEAIAIISAAPAISRANANDMCESLESGTP
jgi:hypothetical protein